MRELLVARRRRTRDVWLSQGLDASPLLAEITDLAAEQRVPVRTVTKERLDAAAQTSAPQGVLAHADPLPEVELDDLARPGAGGTPPFLLVLDGITDPHNFGALLRTAECAGATGVVVPSHRAALVTPTVAKVAAGAIEHLPVAVASSIPSALTRLGRAGVWTVGLDADAGGAWPSWLSGPNRSPWCWARREWASRAWRWSAATWWWPSRGTGHWSR